MNGEGEEGDPISIKMQTPGVILPDLPGAFLEAKSSENSDAGVHHVDLTKVLHLHS